jgi:hypothetical protein
MYTVDLVAALHRILFTQHEYKVKLTIELGVCYIYAKMD